MSGGSDKTEKPTDQKVADARKEGKVAKSADFNSALVMSGAAMIMLYLGPTVVHTLMNSLEEDFGSLAHLGRHTMTPATFMRTMAHTTEVFLGLVAPFTLGICTIGIMAGLIQVRPLFTLKPLTPNLGKLNPVNGVKKLLGMQTQLIAVGKALVKMTIVGIPAWVIINTNMPMLLGLGHMTDLAGAWGVIIGLLGQLITWTCFMMFIIGCGDYAYARYELNKSLMMSKQEVRDERKSQEGSGMVKGKIKKFGQDILKKHQMAKLPTADVLITNPTHFAIALKYDPDLGPAPVVIAKGQDHFALKLKELAKGYGVPIVENKPLARSLYAVVELDQMIPPDLFLAVAEVLAYVFKKNRGRRPKPHKTY